MPACSASSSTDSSSRVRVVSIRTPSSSNCSRRACGLSRTRLAVVMRPFLGVAAPLSSILLTLVQLNSSLAT